MLVSWPRRRSVCNRQEDRVDIDRHDLVTLDGSTFFASDRAGDADGAGVAGLFFRDVRHLSKWQLRVEGEPVSVLTARNVDYYSTRIYATLASVGVGENPTVTVAPRSNRRRRGS